MNDEQVKKDNPKILRLLFATFDRYLVRLLRCICVLCLAALLALLAGNVFVRYVPVAAFYWFDELVEWLFAWMVFFGAAALWARDDHFKLEWLSEKLKGTTIGHVFTLVLECISLFFLCVFFYQACLLTMLAQDWTPVFNVSRRFLYVCMPVSGAVMVAYSLRNCIRELQFLRKLFNGG